MTEKNDLKSATVSRRTVAKGVAWAAPAVALASAAPAFAVSLRKDPGINGWVLSQTYMSAGLFGCTLTDYIDSTPNGNGPDGAPYGLYIYDIEDTNATFSGAAITIWVPGKPIGFTHTARRGHSSRWEYAGSVGTVTKPDRLEYTGYKFNYAGDFDMTEVEERATDARVWLDDFAINITATYGTTLDCGRPTHRGKWVQREITVDRDGDAPRYSREYFCFQRPGSTGYPCDNGANRTASTQSTGSEVVYGEVL